MDRLLRGDPESFGIESAQRAADFGIHAVVPKSVGLVRVDPQFSAPIHWDFEWGIDTCIFDSYDIEQQAKQKELLRHQKKLSKKSLGLSVAVTYLFFA